MVESYYVEFETGVRGFTEPEQALKFYKAMLLSTHKIKLMCVVRIENIYTGEIIRHHQLLDERC